MTGKTSLLEELCSTGGGSDAEDISKIGVAISKSTRAPSMLEKAGGAFTVHCYDCDFDADKIGGGRNVRRQNRRSRPKTERLSAIRWPASASSSLHGPHDSSR
jgi:hypothetical protein